MKIVLFVIIGILLIVSVYEFYTITSLKKEVGVLNEDLGNTKNQLLQSQKDLAQVSQDKQNLDEKYSLLIDDVAEIYKGCIKDNACKGRYPSVSWYCNNVGDEVPDPSHICKCNSSCDLVTEQINN